MSVAVSAAPPRSARITAVVVSGAAFVLYSTTAAPDLGLVDSAELALAAATGGVAHPPGFPLFLLVGRVFATIPLGTPARMLNLMSAFFVALSCGAVLLSVERMLAYRGRRVRAGPAGRADRADGPSTPTRIAAGIVGAASFATAWNPWVWSAVTEVYALNVFLFASAWWCAWCAAVALRESGASASPSAWRWLTASAVLASLGLANHHATAVLAFPVLVGMLAWVRPRTLRSGRFWAIALGSVIASLSVYLYLLIAARHDVALGWGGIDSLARLVRHVTGQQYSLQVGSTAGQAWDAAHQFADGLVSGIGWVPAALVAAALVFANRLPGRVARLSLLAPMVLIGLNLALSAAYIAGPEDRMAYDLPATVAWCLLAGIGAGVLLQRLPFPTPLSASVLIVVLVAANVRHHGAACDLRDERSARHLVEETLERVPEGAVLLTAEWNLYAPYLYLREIEGFRRDVRLIDVLMLRRFWYMDYLQSQMPGLIAESGDSFVTFRDQIVPFDFGLPYDAANMQAYYNAMIHRWIAIGDAAGGAYADLSCYERPQEIAWLSQVSTMPDGLLARLLPGGDAQDNVALPAYDAVNLRYLRRRITDRSLDGDLADLPGRHHPYYRVWRVYQAAVESSLSLAGDQPEAYAARVAAYGEWYPELGRSLERLGAGPGFLPGS